MCFSDCSKCYEACLFFHSEYLLKYFLHFSSVFFFYWKANLLAVYLSIKTSLWNPVATIIKTVLDVYPIFQSLEQDIHKMFYFSFIKTCNFSVFKNTN